MPEEKELLVVEGAVTSTASCSLTPRLNQTRMKKCRRFQGISSPWMGVGCWEADLEEGMETLAVEGAVTGTASRSKNPDGKADHQSADAAITKEESERVRSTPAERQEMN